MGRGVQASPILGDGYKITLPKDQLTHICRHTLASHFVMNGGHILTLQKVLGHSDLKLTMRYAHLAPGYLDEALLKNPMSKNFRHIE